jgi:hypothetical protein
MKERDDIEVGQSLEKLHVGFGVRVHCRQQHLEGWVYR